MKSFAILALVAGAAVAQSVTDLPQCGQTCISNMVNIASSSFGCPAGNVVCYCTNQDFGYGVRDCANEACTNGESGQVIFFGAQYCEGALASASTTGAALEPLTSALATATNTGGASVTDAPQSTAISTQALVSTVTGTDGSTFEATTGFATIYSSIAADASSAGSSVGSALSSITGSAASAASSAASSLASGASSARSSIASSVSSALSSGASEAASVASSLANEATGSPSPTGGAAPMMTGMPVAGAVGLAAWLLL